MVLITRYVYFRYQKSGVKTIDFQGSEVPGNKGYKYYGRAKDLPGVRELLAKADGNEIPMVRSRRDFYKFVDADYYGYRDEEDGRVLEYEQQYQKRGLFQYSSRIRCCNGGICLN